MWKRKFTGKDFDEETQLYYLNARWYDPGIGRFVSEDPVKDGTNWYVYCYNNPLAWIDSNGLQPAPLPDTGVSPSGLELEYYLPGVPHNQLPPGYGFDIYDWNPEFVRPVHPANKDPLDNDDWYVKIPDENDTKNAEDFSPIPKQEKPDSKWWGPPRASIELEPTLPPNYKYVNGNIIAPSGELIPTVEDAYKHANLPQKATELKTIKKGTKEWDEAVKKIREGGKTNFKTETASDAKDLLKEARGNMDIRKRYTDAKYKKGYEIHPSEANTKNAPRNDLSHIKWKDWTDKETGGSGHIFFEKPN